MKKAFTYRTDEANILDLKRFALDLGLNANDILDIAMDLLYDIHSDNYNNYNEKFMILVSDKLDKLDSDKFFDKE